MATLPSILLIRQTKHAARRGIPKAVAYRNNIFDPAAEIESLIEALGVDLVKKLADVIDLRRRNELIRHPENFKPWSL